MKRRTLIAGVGAAGLTGLSGCLGVLGLAEHESSPAGVEAAAREETGYEQIAIEALPIERDVGPTDETVTVTNHMTKHEKSIDMGPLGSRRGAIFNVLTTPQVSILGKTLNPVGEMSTQELMDLVKSNYDGISNISRVEDSEITILEESTTKTQFAADAEFDGRSVDVDIHITEAVEAGDDLLVTIGVYPQYVRDQEEPNIETVTKAVTTEVDEGASTGGSGSDDGGNESSDGSGDNETDGSSTNESSDGSSTNESDDGIIS
jgi:hypothetical protein